MSKNDIYRTPECIDCFDNITKHSNIVLHDFEVKSEIALNKFIGQTSDMFTHLKAESSAYFEAREEKSNDFYTKQELKYDKLEAKLTGMVKWTLGIVLFIVAIYGGVVAASYSMVQNKSDKKDVLSLENSFILRTLGDKYYDQRYVLREGETIDKYTYQWHMNIIYKQIERGEKINDELVPMKN